MTGHDDDWKIQMVACDLFLQLQSAHVGHADVGDQAAVLGRRVVEELPGGCEVAHLETRNFQKQSHGVADIGVVVHDKYVFVAHAVIR